MAPADRVRLASVAVVALFFVAGLVLAYIDRRRR